LRGCRAIQALTEGLPYPFIVKSIKRQLLEKLKDARLHFKARLISKGYCRCFKGYLGRIQGRVKQKPQVPAGKLICFPEPADASTTSTSGAPGRGL